MQLLALDTSTDWLSVAVGDETRWHEHRERAAQSNSERVLPVVSAMLAEAGLTLRDLDGIAFGAGPGAFTGVRIACAVAQGLALAIDRPVVAIPTLAALAQAAWRTRGETRILACLDARMREVYWASYARDGEGWQTLTEPTVSSPQDIVLPGDDAWFGAGDGFAKYPGIANRLALASLDAEATPSAQAIGELALPRFAAGEGVPAAEARPLYVRHRVALTSAERAAGLRL
jgi:tRNA threonylcarbamoyladenosine biosynthesis protein TsaB